MPKSFIEVQDEYKQFKTQFPDDPTPLGEFAKQLDAAQGVQDRAEAYNDAWYKKANAAVDRAFEFTHLPDLAGGATGFVGRGFDALAGTNIAPTAERIGRDLPRMTAEAVLTVPEAASGVGIPAAGAMWGNRINQLRKILGYGGTALSGYASTESPVGGAISAASMGAANKLLLPASHGGMDVTKTVADALRKRMGVTGAEIVPEAGRDLAAEVPRLAFDPANVLKNRLAEAGGAVGAAGAMTGLNEVTRQAQMSVGPHAVGPLDPSRNPLTADNVVGNVMNTLPFALQGAMGVRSASGFNPVQAEQMVKWMDKRKETVLERAEKAAAGQPEFDLKAAVDGPTPKFNEAEMVGARTSIRVLLDAANEAERTNQPWDTNHFRKRAKEVLDMLGMTERDLPMLQQATQELDLQSRMFPMKNVEEVAELSQKVNSLIDFWHENKSKFEPILQQYDELGEPPVVRDEKSLKAFQEWSKLKKDLDEQRSGILASSEEGSPKQAWSAKAVNPLVVKQLQDKGLIPKITHEWLKQEYNATVEDLGGSSPFHVEVLAQKIANRFLDAVPEALKKDRSIIDVTPLSEGVLDVNAKEMAYVRALGEFQRPMGDVKDTVLTRLLDAHKKWREKTIKSDYASGHTFGTFDPWMDRVLEASRTYDAMTGKIVLDGGRLAGRKIAGKEVPLETLWDPQFQPGLRALTGEQGGKERKAEVRSIEEVFGPKDQNIPEGEQSMIEEAMQAGLSGDTSQGAIFRKRGEEGTSPVEDLPIPVETQKAYDDQFYAKSQQLAKTIEALTPKSAWNVMRDVMTGKRAESKNVFREANAKTILQALVEVSGGSKGDAIGPAGKALLAAHEAAGYKNVGKSEREKVRELLKNLFKDYSPLEGVSKTAATPRGDLVVTNRAETALGRQKLVLERLLDPKAVEAAQRYGESRPMEQAGEKPLVRFAAPVRLRRWLASPGMGVTPDSLGQIASKSVESLLYKLGITKDEMAVYKAQGLDKMLASPKVPVEALARWMEEKTPRVEVRKLKPSVVDDLEAQAFAQIQHTADTHRITVIEEGNGNLRFEAANTTPIDFDSLPTDIRVAVDSYREGQRRGFPELDSSDAATGRYGVEPKELKDMPGAVDILVRVPQAAAKDEWKDNKGMMHVGTERPLYRGPHFGDSDVNVLASVRGYVETLPSGERVFHVFEVQSDWGQNKAKSDSYTGTDHHGRTNNPPPKVADHPLLPVYEQLALKAAVAHARELGITKVALSDAETAMMTEGHDRQQLRYEVGLTGYLPELKARSDAADAAGTGPDAVPTGKWKTTNGGNHQWAIEMKYPDGETKFVDLRGWAGNMPLVKWLDDTLDLPKQLPQEKGMRAAYDVRLPSTMTKLVGKAGEYVEFGLHEKAMAGDKFGSPVFKNKTGEPKTSVSARMWDITGAPEEFSAYGYSRPMKGNREGMTEAAARSVMEDDWLGTTPPGSFERDVERTLRAHFTKVLGERGYAGTFRDLAVEAGMAIARQVRDVPVDFYKVKDKVAGLANAVEGRGKVGLNLDEGMTGYGFADDQVLVHKVLSVFTHELAHIDDFIRLGMLEAPDAFSKERKRQLDNLNSMFTALDEDQRRAILLTLDEGLNPPKYRFAVGENPSQLEAATKSPEEFQAGVMQMVTNSLLFGKEKGLKNALEVLDYSPVEIQEHAQFQYRAIRDVLEALEETLAKPELLDASKGAVYPNDPNPFITSHAFSAVVAAAKMGARVREGTMEVAAAREWVKSLSSGAGGTIPQPPTEATWLRRQADISKYHKETNKGPYAMANASEAIEMASREMGMSYKEPGWWSRWLYPFANLTWSMERAGFDLARPLFNLMNDTESAIHRRYSDMVSPFVKRRPDGTFDWDADHPLIQKVAQEKRGPWSKAFNDVSAWQVEHDSQPMFSEVGGQIVVNEAARGDWERIRTKLSLEDQQVVQVASVAADKVGQNMGRHTLSVLDESMTLRVASLLSILDRKMTYDQAYSAADRITEAYVTGNVLSLQGTARPEWMPSLDRLLGGPTGLVSSFKEVEQMLSARTGYRTEQLPGDWIIMYKDAEGLTKFASAPDESRAEYVRNRLVQQGAQPMGEIVNRADLRSKYQAFDDPDVLLQKFAQVEGKAWESVVEDVRTRLGSEIADDLKGSFTPGAASLKDVGQQGFAKFLKPSASQVDRTQLDYLDAMFARVARLSASASYKTHGAMKDLILGDPRARLYPSLRQMVDDHWAQMLAPTSDLTKKIKAVTTGYFLGANLASTAVESTQSILSVIPTLIGSNQSGGPVKAYGQLFKAIGDSTNVSMTTEWQRTAKEVAARLARDPDTKLTAEETRAVMYHRAVTDGIIGHGVIQDLLFSRDAKMLQTAKFGQGDYGPVSKASLAGNGLYMGSQLMTSLYSVASKFNDKIAFFAGLNQGIEKGLEGDALYNHARQFKSLSTFGGGKANTVGWVSAAAKVGPGTRTAVGVVNTLQQYGYGMVALYGQFAKDSIDGSKSLTPAQRSQARKAFGTMLATQVAVGGALGVPFAAASLTLLEKVFGIPANQLVRQGLASLGADDDQGGVIAETVLNGFGNQALGLDVSSRVGVSNLLGTSAYRGFDVQDLLGPTPSLIANMAKALNWFGQNEPVKAARELVPAAFKNLVAMSDSRSKYGDVAIRDASNNLLYTPSDNQAIGYALGFRSRQASQKMQAGHLVQAADQRMLSQQDRELDTQAQRLLQGDANSPRQYARELRYSDPTVSETDVLRGVMERAVRATQERDLLAGGTKRGADERASIVKTFGSDINTRQSEVDMTKMRMQLAARLGDPKLMPQADAWSRAAVIDQLVRSRNMPRSQAMALVQMMGM